MPEAIGLAVGPGEEDRCGRKNGGILKGGKRPLAFRAGGAWGWQSVPGEYLYRELKTDWGGGVSVEPFETTVGAPVDP